MFLLYIERGYVRPTDLVKEFGALLPTIAGLGAKFAASGLIDTVARQSNAREVTYVLTEKGRDTCHQLRRAWKENLPVEAAELTEFESDRWLRWLLEVLKPTGEYILSSHCDPFVQSTLYRVESRRGLYRGSI